MPTRRLEQLEAQARQVDQQWKRQIERAQYEADLARRRSVAVDPDNRLVARSLERDWNDKLADVQRLEREQALLPQSTALQFSDAQRQQIRALARDLPAIWHAATTTWAERKQLLRFLVKDVTLSKRGSVVSIDIRWQTEAVTHLAIPRYQQSWEIRQTSQEVVACVQELAPTHTDTQIAAILNAMGAQAGMGGTFTASKIEWIRYAYAIPLACPERPGKCPTGQRGDGRYSAQAAANLLQVHVSTVAAWCRAGTLDCLRACAHGPLWITLAPEVIATLRKPVQRHWSAQTDAFCG